LSTKMTPRSRHQIDRLEHAYCKKSNALIASLAETSNARKRDYEEEAAGVNKRLKKVDQDMTWDLKSVMEARGLTESEQEEILQHRAERSQLYK
jgi:hypothetical protein